MICTKGSECSDSTHKVKTIKKAVEWFPGVVTSELPISVHQRISKAGRVYARIYACNGDLIHTRG